MKKMVNGEVVEMSAEEISAFKASQGQPEPVPTAVSARQFKLQLFAAGLIDAVDAWVAQQPRDIRISYEHSGTFVRTAPMMAEGFAAMGFTDAQIDAFFAAAALR